MELRFKYQKFQADAAAAVADVFDGQPYLPSAPAPDGPDGTPVRANAPLVPSLTDRAVLENIRRVQRRCGIAPSPALEGRYNLTVEMETGVGKTYTYIKTMYELSRRYGWSRFIVVVPSIAVREGVYRTFEVTQDHFAEMYGRRIRFFLYRSTHLTEIDRFASDGGIHAMIINAQAFNAHSAEARRITQPLDEFRSRRPIDVLAGTRPILIIDEPQSVEGRRTRERLQEFRPLLTLRYSATPRETYNLVYRLDALDAYRLRLVKKIAVLGIEPCGGTAPDGFLYCEGIRLGSRGPVAALRFSHRGKAGVRTVTQSLRTGDDLYACSGNLAEYRNGFTVKQIDGISGTVTFENGLRLAAGTAAGSFPELQLRRIQIRETILTHLRREQALFPRGIKVLSLFFIDEVDHYRLYDADGTPRNGIFARMFEEEYRTAVEELRGEIRDPGYLSYLDAIPAEKTHAGYFSVDRHGRMVDEYKGKQKVTDSEDVSAFDLIMRSKERLLEQDPVRSPVRFLFSHSALREGWDNPNVFQICTLKSSGSEVRKRQEVGRGMRLCVDQNGERMDESVLGDAVHEVNVLTVIASQSYEAFARGLQSEVTESLVSRPRAVTASLFAGRTVAGDAGGTVTVSPETAAAIVSELTASGLLTEDGRLTQKYRDAVSGGTLCPPPSAAGCGKAVLALLATVGDAAAVRPENARAACVELEADPEKLGSPAFRGLWSRIGAKSVYTVRFPSDELVRRCIETLDRDLVLPDTRFRIGTGTLEAGRAGASFTPASGTAVLSADSPPEARSAVCDPVGRLAQETGLTRRDIVRILTGIRPACFAQFKRDPEEFLLRASRLLCAERDTEVAAHISYTSSGPAPGTDVFTAAPLRGIPGKNAFPSEKHLWGYVLCGTAAERKFVAALDACDGVDLYLQLPAGFSVPTPAGPYTPRWAVAFRPGWAEADWAVVETRTAPPDGETEAAWQAKLRCARAHFAAVSGGGAVFATAADFEALLRAIRRDA